MGNKCTLWDPNQENTCGYCIYAKRMADGENVICKKKNNVFSFSATCRKFEFDILKKDVRRRKMPDFGKFSKENFEL